MYYLIDDAGNQFVFKQRKELEKYIETRHASEDRWSFISSITDDYHHEFGVNWRVEVEEI